MAVEEFGEMPALGALMRRAVTGTIGRTIIGPRLGPRRRSGPGEAAGPGEAHGARREAGSGAGPGGGGAGATPGEAGALDSVLLVRDVRTDLEHLTRYTRACGFRLSTALPPTYPHVAAFPLSLELMTRGDFPFALLGLVHLQNTIEHLRPVAISEPLDVAVRAGNLREHERGRTIDLLTTCTVNGVAVWRERSVYLRRSGKSERAPDGRKRGERERTAAPRATAIWRVPVSTGPAYAAVSGDRNPIHTSRLAAGLLGFPRPIAHGMWTMARCLAALEGRLPEAYTVDVLFKLPVLLPATVSFSTDQSVPRERRFALHDAGSGKPHLAGVVQPES
jgi:hypothetical protein